MQTINRKGRLVETYSLILIDLIAVLGAYMTALLLRFGNVHQAISMQLNYTVGIYMMLFCVLYGVMSDWNRGFFRRGFFVEGIAVLKYDVVMMIAIVVIMYLTHIAGDYSRLIFGYFAVANAVYTFALHCVFKVFMLDYYSKSNNSDKLMIVTEAEYAEEIIKKIKEAKAWDYEVTSIAIMTVSYTHLTLPTNSLV